MISRDAREILRLPESFTFAELKTAFRAKSFFAHPDAGGSDEAFRLLVEAFDLLKGSARIGGDKETVEGRPLSELGQGYPLTESAKTCELCEGRGYRIFHRRKRQMLQCDKCGGTGLNRYPCRKCEGEGSYVNSKGKRRKCSWCEGSGWFYPSAVAEAGVKESTVPFIPGTKNRGRICFACDGTGEVEGWVVREDEEEEYYAVCERCNGVGETKLFNPVIPRGLFAQLDKAVQKP